MVCDLETSRMGAPFIYIYIYIYIYDIIYIYIYDISRLTVNELQTTITAYINISQAYLQKVFANKIKRVQAIIDARGRHFHHLL